MNNWIYRDKEITSINDFNKDVMGFVYATTHIPSGKKYIGKKFLVHTQKRKLGKKELKIFEGQKGRPPKFKVVSKESNWKTYFGSNKQLLELLKTEDKDNFKREILHLCTSKKSLTYYETKFQFCMEVLENPNEYFNDNILGKFFTRDFGDIK
jgi:hypothetical protein|tara:strand:+ start:58 stop:516 length:459 start_codon:yes stop_codon:yes gene_type:complete